MLALLPTLAPTDPLHSSVADKQSGIGREQGEEALHNYTNVKSIHINLSSESPFFSGSKL